MPFTGRDCLSLVKASGNLHGCSIQGAKPVRSGEGMLQLCCDAYEQVLQFAHFELLCVLIAMRFLNL